MVAGGDSLCPEEKTPDLLPWQEEELHPANGGDGVF